MVSQTYLIVCLLTADCQCWEQCLPCTGYAKYLLSVCERINSLSEEFTISIMLFCIWLALYTLQNAFIYLVHCPDNSVRWAISKLPLVSELPTLPLGSLMILFSPLPQGKGGPVKKTTMESILSQVVGKSNDKSVYNLH